MKNVIDLLKIVFCGLFVMFAFAACEEDEPTPEKKPVAPTAGVFILNQGAEGQNNAGISYYDFKTGEVSSDITYGSLGDIGQDMIIYGNKMYVSVFNSGVISVFDLDSTIGLLKRIEVSEKPRSLVSYAGKIYASTWGGNVIKIDTTSLTIEAVANVGANPEGIAIANGKMYVANTNGMAYPNFDNTVSVLDIATFTETKKITVGLNPNCLMADDYGDIYLSYNGNYGDVPNGMQKIDTKTDAVTNLDGVSSGMNFTIVDDTLYYFNVNYNLDGTTSCTFGRYNVKTEQKVSGEVITDGTNINPAYAIGVAPDSKDIYISTGGSFQTGSKVYIFNSAGVLKKTIEVGVFAYKFVFI